jgi:hypothetical protein
MTADEIEPYRLDVAPELLEHTEHLPEVEWCRCGFRHDPSRMLAG